MPTTASVMRTKGTYRLPTLKQSTMQPYALSQATVWRRVGPDIVVTLSRDFAPHLLSGPSAELWRLLHMRPATVTELAAALHRHYEADLSQIEGDVEQLLDQLRQLRLVDVVEA